MCVRPLIAFATHAWHNWSHFYIMLRRRVSMNHCSPLGCGIMRWSLNKNHNAFEWIWMDNTVQSICISIDVQTNGPHFECNYTCTHMYLQVPLSFQLAVQVEMCEINDACSCVWFWYICSLNNYAFVLNSWIRHVDMNCAHDYLWYPKKRPTLWVYSLWPSVTSHGYCARKKRCTSRSRHMLCFAVWIIASLFDLKKNTKIVPKKPGAWNAVKRRETGVNAYYIAWTPIK